MPEGPKLPRVREQAIAALLTEKTLDEAAAKAGVSVRTLKYWLRKPGFRKAYRWARGQVLEHVVGRLQTLAADAVQTLHDSLKAEGENVRLGAARTILELAGKFKEVELDERLATLEKMFAERGTKATCAD